MDETAPLKERSRLSVSNVKSANVRLATGLGTGRRWPASRFPSKKHDRLVARNCSMKRTRSRLRSSPVRPYLI